jgi:NifU-like protein involved in Fe-S cluster formation
MSDIPKNIQLLNYKLVHQRVHQALDLFAISSNAMRDNIHKATAEEAEALNQEMRDMLKQCSNAFVGRPEYLVYLVLISLVVDTVEVTLQGQKSLAQKNDLVN